MPNTKPSSLASLSKSKCITLAGNSVVDLVYKNVPTAFLEAHGLTGAEYHEVPPDDPVLEAIRALPDQEMVAGGSVANSAYWIGRLGGRAKFISAVGDDDAGRFFLHSMHTAGVECFPPQAGKTTTVSHVLIEEGTGKRTLVTVTGTAQLNGGFLHEYKDILYGWREDAGLLVIEGYLFENDPLAVPAAFVWAREHHLETWMTLAADKVVQKHADTMLYFIDAGFVDTVVCNHKEIDLLMKGCHNQPDLYDALKHVNRLITHGKKGAEFIYRAGAEEESLFQRATPLAHVVSDNGAGDAFLGAFLDGRQLGLDTEACIRLGQRLALEILRQPGARDDSLYLGNFIG